MARRIQTSPGDVNSASSTAQYVKLEQRLVLLAWLNRHLGYERNRDLLADMKGVAEGFDASGLSHIYHQLEARGDKVKIPLTVLARYERNIRENVRTLNAGRSEPITLRYFQHLAVLYAEIFLDWYFHHPRGMLDSLNQFVDERNAARSALEPKDTRFCESDLKKMAFWMATGSGKTLIMHINYRQFLQYNNLPLDKILLITPNEGLSSQHMNDMADSGILARRFDLNESGLFLTDRNVVQVIEITKLVEEKRGAGVSVPVEAFEGNNLIFVDEGHKGSSGEAWRGFRDALGETGFTFEYSATFGQALTAARNDRLTSEYGKSIIFDYSYRYFHGDGYGKDFHVLNLQKETTEKETETLLLGNLLSFYEQKRVFDEQTEALKPYNIEKPLWVFVGRSVLPGRKSSQDRKLSSDVLAVARFLHYFLENKRNWAVKTIHRLIEGKSGLITARSAGNQHDIFENRLKYLRNAGKTPEHIYRDILAGVLHAPASGALHLCDIRGSAGELGLKSSGGTEYFGLIYIGDTSMFKKLVEEDDSGIAIEQDSISESLFRGIHKPDTKINILIGAKKFMEGWNSWRVSNMGLLNTGRREGPQVIQLFGRGVRLRGRDRTLKRSSALGGQHPDNLRLLETLDVFAVRADYMADFRECLEKEGIETEESIELSLPIRPDRAFLGKGLVVPRKPEERNFGTDADIMLECDPSVRVRVDMSLRVQALESSPSGIIASTAQKGQERPIPPESLELVDWERVYLDMLEYKQQRGLRNLIVRAHTPRKILETVEPRRLYSLVADASLVRPESFAAITRLQEAVVAILRRYMDAYYRVNHERWDTRHMVYKTLDENDPNLSFAPDNVADGTPGGYVVKIQPSEGGLVNAVENLIADLDVLYEEESGKLPRIHFDRHLYQPLLVECGAKLRMSPPGLNEGEWQFVQDLRDYWEEEKDRSLANAEVFLLRNLSRGKGIGFFEERGFYPDFILWIVTVENQHIVFLDPHGMIHSGPYRHDRKARLHESLPDLAREINARCGREDVTLDSYIISATPYEVLQGDYDDGAWDRGRFSEAHILFQTRSKEYDYIEEILANQLARSR